MKRTSNNEREEGKLQGVKNYTPLLPGLAWYIDLNRSLIAKNGKDYLGDRTRWFWFGDHGNLFAPGIDRSR